MKKLLFICGLLWSAFASAQFTPFVPGQILTAAELNTAFSFYAPLAGASFSGPVSGTTGSFSGLVSVAGLTATGTISLPTGSLPLSYLATQSANTVVANATGSAVTPVALALPSCSTTTSSLQWTSGTGFNCFTGSAPLASPTFTGSPTVPGYLTTASAATTYAPVASPTFTGTVTAAALTTTGNFTPAQTAGIVGTTTNNNANAGSVGEFLTNSTTAVPLSNGSYTTIASVTLTAGDWDVSGNIRYIAAGTTTMTAAESSISSTTNVRGTDDATNALYGIATGAGIGLRIPAPVTRFSVASSTIVYLTGVTNFNISTMTANGFIRARRIR